MPQGTNRNDIHPGTEVDIVLKKDQPTGTLTHGIVQALLTSKAVHPRGIKVRLQSGQVGRVQNIYVNGVKYENPEYQPSSRSNSATSSTSTSSNAEAEDFDNFI